MRTFQIPNAIVLIGGVAGISAGLLTVAGFALHPAGEDATFGTDPFWAPAHGLLWLSCTVALLGWVGVYLAQASKAGMLGVVGFVVIVLGTALVSWIYSGDVAFVPVIAAESPQLFDKIFGAGHLALGIGSVLTWVLGNVLFGLSIVRAKVFPRAAGILLALGTLIIPIAYLAGFPVRVVALGAFVAAMGQIWLGYELLRIGKTP